MESDHRSLMSYRPVRPVLSTTSRFEALRQHVCQKWIRYSCSMSFGCQIPPLTSRLRRFELLEAWRVSRRPAWYMGSSFVSSRTASLKRFTSMD